MNRRLGLFLSAKRGTNTTATVSTAGCCAPPVVICRRARAGEQLNWGRARSFAYINVYFPTICYGSIDGKGGVHS